MTSKTIVSVTALRTQLAQDTGNQLRIVDCRHSLSEPDLGFALYKEGHLPGAVYAHLDDDLAGPIELGKSGRHPLPDPKSLARKLGAWGIDNATQVVAYDQAGGAIAARLWWLLRWLGHDAVAVLDGGYAAWVAASGAIEQDQPAIKSVKFAATPNQALQVSATMIEAGKVSLLVDSREHARYLGEVEPIDSIAGHIPGAVNRPFANNLERGRFKEPAVLRAEFEALLLPNTASEDAVFYCGSGVTAAHNLLAMAHAGLEPGRLYNGSWSEWVATGRPVSTGPQAAIGE